MNMEKITFDESQREFDQNGFLQVKKSLLTRESVDGYLGADILAWGITEIDNAEIDPSKVYFVYRPAKELERATRLFSEKPLIYGHSNFDPSNPPADDIVGTTGSNPYFESGGIYNSLSFWSEEKGIAVLKEINNLSVGYKHNAKVEKGTWIDNNGKKWQYDIVFEDIVPQHVALVRNGRVDGARVFDEQITQENKMTDTVKAKDTIEEMHKKTIERLDAMEKQIKDLLDKKANDVEVEIEVEKKKDDESAKDSETDPKEDEDKKKAFDEAVLEKVNQVVDEKLSEIKNENESVAQAIEDTKEVLGDFKFAKDSKPSDIYKIACDSMNIKTDDVKPEEMKAFFKGSKLAMDSKNKQGIAVDSAVDNDSELMKMLSRIKTEKTGK